MRRYRMRISQRGRRARRAGLSMIELLVSMVIVTVIGTMLIAGWISLQRSFAFAQAKNTTRATARDVLERMSSELRAAQPTSVSTTPFNFVQPAAVATMPTPGGPAGTATMPTVGGPYACIFWSAYNYRPSSSTDTVRVDGTGVARLRLTAIWLDTSGAKAQKTLYWTRDTNNSNTLDAGDRTVVLARNVVNYALAKPVFIYFYRDATTTPTTYYPDPLTVTASAFPNPLTSTSVADLVSVQIEIVADINLARTPSYIDLKTTVRPRNALTN
jgi:type II secretory pathway pseudopilin PulG